MKKIYMILAAMSLLSMSLNAQIYTQTKAKPLSKTQVATFNFNKMLRGIKGMESILSVSGQANGQFRAPLRYDADLFNTLGPFSGDNFDYGIGFPEAYPEGSQDILVTTVLNRSEYESHIGEEIVGFRFALWGDASKTVKVADFITYPMNSNSGFDQNHLYEWTLADLEGNEPPSGDEPGGETVTKYVKVTSSDDLTSGEYLIVCEAQNVIFDGSTTTLNGSNYATAPTISNNAIEYTADLDGKDFTIDMSNGTVKSASGYYIGCESGSNAITFNQNTQYTNTITVNSGIASIIYKYNNANRPLKCNTQNNVFRYYKTTSENVADIQLYKKVAVPSSKAPRRADRETVTVVNNDFSNASWWTVYDENNDNTTWSVSGGYATYPYNSSNAANDWLVSSSIALEAGKTYTFKLDSWRRSASYEEKLEVKLASANTVSALSAGTTVITETAISSTSQSSPDQLSNTFTVSSSGNYYIGIHAVSGANKWALYVDNMIIETDDAGGDSNEGYVELVPGQWHEFYLDQPVEFQVENDDDQLFMGYWYKQYPLSSQNDEVMNPAAVNSQSTGHSHYVNMVAGSAGAGDLVISLPYSMNIRTITVYDTNGNTLTTWDASTAYNNSDYTSVSLDGSTYAAYNLPTGWSISDGNYLLSWRSSSYGRLGYLLGDDDLTIASSALNGNTTVRVVMNVYDDNGSGTISVNGQSQTISGSSLANYTWNNVDLSATVYERSWFNPDFSEVGDLAVQLIFKTTKPTPEAPTVTPATGDANVTITISPDEATDGELVYTYYDQNGNEIQNATNPMTFERGATDYVITVHAYTTETENYNQSPEAVVTVTIPALPKTDMPVITSEQVGDYLVITATGNGIVTLNIPGYPEAQGNGSASISVPCGVVSSTVTATATAQEDGKQKSDPREQTITIPAGEGWNEMTGTYEDDDDLLSLEVKVGNDTIDIMMVDQFVASTYSNEHSDGYTYTMQETVNDVDWFSNPAPIPVFKTSSTLQGLYTQTQVDNDTLMQYRANVLNTEIDYTVKPDPMVMYYDLYRGGKNEVYPVVDPGTEISRLQQFSDEANAQYFYYETHQSGIAPRYDHVGEQLVERIDTSYVNGTVGDQIAYVPVIWVPGLSTARGDGKNNSYGSDIKYNELGGVNISVEGWKNDENNTTGQWDSNGMTYCVYSPIITLNGITPEIVEAHDGETYQYVPYMYRVWCTYPSAHNFTFRANPDGRKHLVDAGPIEAPFLIGEATAEDSVWHNNGEEVVFGRALASGEVQQPWSFGVPKTEDSQNVKFIARFYYKKIVTPAAQANGLRGNRDGEEAFAIAENGGDGHGILTGIDELWNNVVYVVSKTYVNAQGMQSDKPFDGLNIVVTRFSDGTTTTTKVVR